MIRTDAKGLLRHIIGFELRYQLGAPVFWGTCLVFFLLTFGAVASDDVRLGWGGQVYRNAPFAIATALMLMTVFAVFIMTAFVASVVLRDDESGFGPLLQATPLPRSTYLFGRFTGGFLVGALAFLAVPLGALAALGWSVDPDTVGVIRIGDYLYVYLFLCLPTLFLLAATCFALATISRSIVTTYVGVLVLLALYFFLSLYLSRPELGARAMLADPFGLSSLDFATRTWSAFDRNTRLPPIAGVVLWNRLLWIAVGIALLAAAWRSFSRTGFAPRRGLSTKRERTVDTPAARAPSIATPRPQHRSLGWRPLLALTRFELRTVVRSPVFAVLLGIAFLTAFINLWLAGEDTVSTIYPVTRAMIQTLHTTFRTIPLFIAAFYAGELVWRDRERRIHEIVDATPAPDWTFLLPKLLAILTVMLAMGLVTIGGAIGVQLAKGFTRIEPGHYLIWYLAPWFADMVLFAVLALFVQTLVPHKFVGLLVMLLYYVAQSTLPTMGWDDHLYLYATTPPVPLSDMNGLGQFAGYAAWFRAYWFSCAVLLLVLAYGLWRRGNSAPLAMRLRRLPVRLRGTPVWIGAGAAAAMAAFGGFIFYNTHVLNDYRSIADSQRWAAEYEKTLLPLEAMLQPKIVAVTLKVDLYPDRPMTVTTGRYVIENKTGRPLDRMMVGWSKGHEERTLIGPMAWPDLEMQALDVEGADVERDLPQFHARLFRFDRPLAPGERRAMSFQTLRQQHGFRNSSNEDRIVGNGTFVENYRLAPWLGVLRWPMLQDRAVRRRYGLTPDMPVFKLDDPRGRQFNYFTHDSDYVTSDITVTGPADQILLAPGRQIVNAVKGGRRIARFRSESPILNFFSIQSARYAVRHDRWRNVAVDVFYHPTHAYNVDRMVAIAKDGLDYYSKNFSPYQFDQFRIVEFPAYGNFAQAFPNTVPYSEAAGFIIKVDDKSGIDYINYVTAHELAHQWWAHQLIGGDQQGSTVLSETLAQYSSLMVMEKRYGPAMIRRYLASALRDYVAARGKENVAEPPLERVQEQGYVRYAKGGMVMYLLRDRMGEAAVNRALRSLLKRFAFKGAPYPTSRDLVAALRAEAAPGEQQLITDLFQRITFYDLTVSQARATRQRDGKWRLSMIVEAHKRYADGNGREREAPLDEPFDLGVFARDPRTLAFGQGDVASLRPQLLRSGTTRLDLVLDRQPRFVGIDPYGKYIDRDPRDNVAPVEGAAQ
jgi:ABC-type transport system involved in multi-copper enzyme maturation permease subunit